MLWGIIMKEPWFEVTCEVDEEAMHADTRRPRLRKVYDGQTVW